MEAALTAKPEAGVKSQVAIPVRPGAIEGENGAPVGMPIFLQRSVLSRAGADAIQLKCDNCAEGEEEENPTIQFKLTIGAPNDAYEQEADRVADAVNARAVDQPAPILHAADERVQQCSACAAGQPCSKCAAKSSGPKSTDVLQKKPVSKTSSSSSLTPALGSTATGTPVSSAIRERVEPVLGVDLSHVQVHSDAAAQVSARRLEAKAFTHQNHIWLGPHQSADDVALMAHELTHVVQQTGAGELIQRQPEDASEDGETVRRRLQQRIDEAVGDEAPAAEAATEPTSTAIGSGAAPATTAAANPQARSAALNIDRREISSESAELAPDAQPDVDRAEQAQPGVEQATRETVEQLNNPPEPQAEGAAPKEPAQGAAEGEGAAGAERAGKAAVEQVTDAAEGFAAADSVPAPDTPTILTPPPEVEPFDAGGMPLAGNSAADVQAVELANDAQNLREQGQLLREYSAEDRANAQILRGNIGLVGQGIGTSEGGVQTAQSNAAFRRGLLDQARQALSVSQQKAADVSARAPGGVTQAGENKSRSGPMASESREMTAQNEANAPDDPEAAARAREQGGQLNRAGSDAANIDDTITQVQGGAGQLVQDAARATQVNTQSVGTITGIDATLTQTEGRVAEMQGQNAEARAQVAALSEGPAEVSTGAEQNDADGQDLVQSSIDVEARLHAMQQTYADGMKSVPAVAPPKEEEEALEASPVESPAEEIVEAAPETSPAAAAPMEAGAGQSETFASEEVAPLEEAAPSAETIVQRTPEEGAAATPAASAAAQPSNINIAAGLPSWLTGEPEPNAEERERAQREQDEKRQQELDLITEELHGRRFEQLSAGERRRIALRLATRNMFSGIGNISWPTPGGLARGAAHLAAGLIDPRAPMMGVVSGLNMIANATVNFARAPSWEGALRAAANIATGLTIILGSITALAGVIAALMTAITILSLGIAAPITGPIIAFCASVMSVVGTWTFWVGLIAAGLQALVFLVDLYKAGTAETAEALQQQSERMREDASQAGNALLQAGMGRLAAVGGRAMQAEIRAAGGGVRFAARMAVRAQAAPGRALAAVRSAGARAGTRVGAFARRVASGAGRLPGQIAGAARALPGRIASGAGALARGAAGLPGRVVSGARALAGRVSTGAGELAGGARSFGGRVVSGARALPGRISQGASALAERAATGAAALPGRIVTGARAVAGRVATGVGELATGAANLPGRAIRGVRAVGTRMREQLREGFSRDFLVGEGIPRGSGFSGLRTAAARARERAIEELAEEALAARAAAEAGAARAEGSGAHLDDVAPEPAPAREASVGESSHLDSDRLSGRQLRNEVDQMADHPELMEGAPPHRTARMGEHQWREEPQGWCRLSGRPRCFDHNGVEVEPTRLPEAQRPLDIHSYLPEGTTTTGPQRSFRIRAGWREEVRELGLGNQDVIYVLRDAQTGEALKVGLSENISSRFGAYQTATLERYSGREIIADVMPVSVPRSATGASALVVPETAVREQLERELVQAGNAEWRTIGGGRRVLVDAQDRVLLPWDNTGNRLNYFGQGTPGASLDRTRGWGWADVSEATPRREQLVPLEEGAQLAARQAPMGPLIQPPSSTDLTSWIREYQVAVPTGRRMGDLQTYIIGRYRDLNGRVVSSSLVQKWLSRSGFGSMNL